MRIMCVYNQINEILRLLFIARKMKAETTRFNDLEICINGNDVEYLTSTRTYTYNQLCADIKADIRKILKGKILNEY